MSTITIIIDGQRINNLDEFSLDVVDPDYTGSSITVQPEFGNARIDWKETPVDHVFMADLPGLKKEEVIVEVIDGMGLEISGERRQDVVATSDTWHRRERSGKFLRRIRLPENANVDQAKAALKNGVLTVIVPKTQDASSQIR